MNATKQYTKKSNRQKIIYVVKANGESEPFDENKIRRSLVRSGAGPEIIDAVLRETSRKIYPGITTRKLYRLVFNELRKRHRPAAGKYHLKKGIMELGPTGFPFEEFVAELFKSEGYQTVTDKIIEGYCVKHEVDVIASDDKNEFMMECKFHSDSGIVCDVKIALYVRARFWDIEKKLIGLPVKSGKQFKGWLVTNSRMTADAEQYGTCTGLGLMSWNFPHKDSLRERIDRSGLHPVTCITSLTKSEKQQLLDKKIVLARDLCINPAVLTSIGVSEARKGKILNEARFICKKKNTDTN